MQFQCFMHTADIPRLDTDGVDPWEKPKPGGKMLEDRVLAELVLFVVFSWADLLILYLFVYGALIRHKHDLIPA